MKTKPDISLVRSLKQDYPPPQVRSLGKSIFDPIWREYEHTGKDSEIMHVVTGKVNQVMRDFTVHGEINDTIYTPQSMPHRDVFSDDAPFKVYLVHFNWEGEKQLLKHVSPEQLADIPDGTKKQVHNDFVQLYRDFQANSLMAKQLVNLRLLQIILTMTKSVIAKENGIDNLQTNDYNWDLDQQPIINSRSRQIMQEAREVISKRYKEPLTLGALAKAVHVSPYHLSHAFSKENSFTLSSYITNIRMKKARQMLRSGKLNVSEVAYAVGYNDPSYFSRVFKAHYGKAPSSFRGR